MILEFSGRGEAVVVVFVVVVVGAFFRLGSLNNDQIDTRRPEMPIDYFHRCWYTMRIKN